MRLASFSLQTFQRPRLLRECLRHLQSQEVPEGWALEIVVAAPEGDPGIKVARSLDQCPHPVKVCISPGSSIGEQSTTRLANVSGEIVMQSGDDDLQRMDRLRRTVEAWEGMTVPRPIGFERFLYANTSLRAVAVHEGPSHRAGATLTIPGEWAPLAAKNLVGLDYRIHGDRQLGRSLAREGLDVADYEPIECSMTCVDHGKNVSGPRPWPRKGQKVKQGDFFITGLRWDEVLRDLPDLTRESLEILCFR